MALAGFFKRREVWFPTFRFWLALLLSSLLFSLLSAKFLHPFLAVTERLDADVLVVEGWLPGNAMRVVADEFKTGHYTRVFVVGGAIENLPVGIAGVASHAEAGALALAGMGIDSAKITAVPDKRRERARTWGAAKAFRAYADESGLDLRKGFNLATMGVHARRSRLLYREAFQERVSIGVVSVPSDAYDPARWWRSSVGFKDTVGEAWTVLFYRLVMLGED